MGSAPSSSLGQKKALDQGKSYKVVLVGDASSGKTNIYLRYCKNQFDFQHRPTTSVSIGTAVRVVSRDKKHVSVQLWDLPGEEAPELRHRYYKDADAAIVVVDCANGESIDSSFMWYTDVTSHTSTSSSESTQAAQTKTLNAPPMPVLLMGAKHDLLDSEDFIVTEQEREELISKFEAVGEQAGFMGSVYVSAKSGDSSVYAAVNFLLRYLSSSNTLSEETSDQQEEVHEPKDTTDGLHRTKKEKLACACLQTSGMEEIDKALEEVADTILTVKRMASRWQRSRKEFSRVCRVLPGSGTASLSTVEQCCLMIKGALQRKGLSLQLTDDSDSCPCLVVDMESSTLTAGVHHAIEVYQMQVVAVMKDILVMCPQCSGILAKSKDDLERAYESPESGKRNRKRSLKQNHVSVTDAIALAEVLVKDIEATQSRIRACLAW